MLKTIKIGTLALHIMLAIVLTSWFVFIRRWQSHHPRYNQTIQWWFTRICNILGLKIRVHGEITEQPLMYVANHVSWLDIPLIASLANPRFLSKQEVRHWPVIGWLADKSGTLFISRGNSSSSNSANQQLTDSLKNKQSVLVFPEGTTTLGTGVSHFHGRLLGASIDTGSQVQPLAIRYLDEQQPDLIVPFVGEQTIAANLWSLLGRKTIYAEVHFLEPLDSENRSRNELARLCERSIKDKVAGNS